MSSNLKFPIKFFNVSLTFYKYLTHTSSPTPRPPTTPVAGLLKMAQHVTLRIFILAIIITVKVTQE